jgi:hypothetical protein
MYADPPSATKQPNSAEKLSTPISSPSPSARAYNNKERDEQRKGTRERGREGQGERGADRDEGVGRLGFRVWFRV